MAHDRAVSGAVACGAVGGGVCARSVTRAIAVSACVVLAACTGRGSTLDPAGPNAAQIADLTWALATLGLVVYVLVLATLLVAILRRQRETPLVRDSLVIVAGGIVLPLVVLPLIWTLTLVSMRQAAERPVPAVTIEVTAHQWWYEVRYPLSGVVLRDELRIPTGRPVLLRLRSADVIHSFWVPRLAGKMDMIPGRTNELVLEASRPGRYFGQCAEFCGLWHARMHFEVIAEEPAAFQRWLEERGRMP
jgi:cytochrome c oxidase subunit 2